MKNNLITIDAREANLKRKIRRHLKNLGFTRDQKGGLVPPELNKDTYRKLHEYQRAEKLAKNMVFLKKKQVKLIKYFASGYEVRPSNIKPRLELVSSPGLQSDLFRFASLYWNVPVSEGYGRRLRFLVWDDSNGKLIGIFALGDAVFNLRARDSLIGWDSNQRTRGLINLMDAYVLGAVPPYNSLLCGKLIACLIRTKEVVQIFEKKYKNSKGIISGKKKKPQLAVVTTTSSLGRSSIYNRLKLNGKNYLSPIGFTSGWGHFHIPDDLFTEMRDYLKMRGDVYSNNFEFGNGPNWRMRAIKKVFNFLGLSRDLVQHGLYREVFFGEIADNALAYLREEDKILKYGTLPSVSEVSELALRRWIIPRGLRRPEYMTWQAPSFLNLIQNSGPVIDTKGASKNAFCQGL